MVALDSSEARMPRPRAEMCLAVARSSSSKGLAAALTTKRERRPEARGAETACEKDRRRVRNGIIWCILFKRK